ncbi:MAG: phosphatase PAP2 family protein, partial [Steroidobacteraceae bacterium]
CAGPSARTDAPPAAGNTGLPASSPQMATASTLPGYLAPGAFDIMTVLPPAPRAGEARYEHDRRVFRDTRALEGSPRWLMAASDAELSNTALLQHFSCSLGIELKPEQAPRLMTLLQRVSRDTSSSVGTAKDYYKRQRPFWIDAGNTCRPREELGQSFDYPSGHTTAGWTWALVLTQVAPDHATALLARGRSYGESRIVCGVHNASAVEGGRLTATAVVTVAAATADYQHDLVAARTELASLRHGTHNDPAPARCATEVALEKIP